MVTNLRQSVNPEGLLRSIGKERTIPSPAAREKKMQEHQSQDLITSIAENQTSLNGLLSSKSAMFRSEP